MKQSRFGHHLGFMVSAFLLTVAVGCSYAEERPAYSGISALAGPAAAEVTEGGFVLENRALRCQWEAGGGANRRLTFTNKLTKQSVQAGSELFEIVSDANTILIASGMALETGPVIETLSPEADSTRLSDRVGGKKVSAIFRSPDGNLRARWQVLLHDGSNYLIESLYIESLQKDAFIEKVVMQSFEDGGAKVAGSVSGCPVIIKDKGMFFALEHPLADNTVDANRISCAVTKNRPLRTGEPLTVTGVLGVCPEGQLRRGFQYYVERERAFPYRPFLHYNSWYDIAYHDRKMNEAQCLDRVQKFGERFIKPYGVDFASFLFDDGWDDSNSLWSFHEGFPQGFTNIARRADEYHAAVGVWLSPWGGYSQAKKDRLAYGRGQGFEINKSGFSLSGPKYYRRFRQVCLDMIRDYGVNSFKFDGIAAGSRAASAEDYISDVEALLRLSRDLRRAKGDVFINLTTGTWPSPYWLWYGDSIWRQDRDWWQAGSGSPRQQWLTYRDGQVYERIVSRSPLFPLNSLMLHGIIFADLANGAKMSQRVDADLEDEIWSFFGTGTALQELYITPDLMNEAGWAALAKAAKWSHQNAGTLVDTHWIGGNPLRQEVYGWASWSPQKGIFVLRNPGPDPQPFQLTPAEAFELPPGAAAEYDLFNVRKARKEARIKAGQSHPLMLDSFEVRVLEATPVNDSAK